MNSLIRVLGESKKFSEYVLDIENKKSPIQLSGLSVMGKIQIVEATREFINRNILLITYNEIQAKNIVSDLKYFSNNVLFFPKREIAAYDYDSESLDIPYERIETLNKLYEIEKSNDSFIVVTTIEALMQKMICKNDLYSNIIEFSVGKTYDLEEIKKRLISFGYKRSEMVDGKGMFSIRGGILDIGISQTKGLRIEFWGDDVDSIRTFSTSSQRSIEMLENATIHPSNEFVITKSLDKICDQISKREEYSQEDIKQIKNGQYISKIDKYFNCFYNNSSNLLEYIDKNFLVVLDDFNKINKRQENIFTDNNQLVKLLIEKSKVVPDSLFNIEKLDISDISNNQIVYLDEGDVLGTSSKSYANKTYNFKYRDVHFYKNEVNVLIKEIQECKDKKTKVVILSGNENGGKKIGNLLEQENIPYCYIKTIDDIQIVYNHNIKKEFNENQVIISDGILSSGFRDYELNLLVITGEEFLAVEKKRKRTSNDFTNGEKVVFADLASGDFVVHKYNGIGQYIGVNTITSGNITKDYIKIKYRNDDILYVPTDSLDNIRKYIAGGEKVPSLNKLGSKEWERTKSKVKSNLREVAKDLIELYAKRKNAIRICIRTRHSMAKTI